MTRSSDDHPPVGADARRQAAASEPELPFEPWGAATGIGSLPHTDVGRALELIAASCPELPYWPQLPHASPSEVPLRRALGPLAPYVTRDRGALVATLDEPALLDVLGQAQSEPTPMPPALSSFLEAAIGGRFPRARAAKGQLYGPVTLLGLLRVGDRPAIELPGLVAAVAVLLARQAQAQAEALAMAGVPVILFVDEPGLAVVDHLAVDRAAAVAAVETVIAGARAGGAHVGLHLCRGDAAVRVDTDLAGVDGVAADTAFPPDGELVCWAAFGPDGRPSLEQAAGRLLGRWASAGVDRAGAVVELSVLRDGLRRTVLTPSCGLALSGIDRADRTQRLVQALSAHVRRLVLEELAPATSAPDRAPDVESY